MEALRDEAEDIRLELVRLLANWEETQVEVNLVKAKALLLQVESYLKECLLKKGE